MKEIQENTPEVMALSAPGGPMEDTLKGLKGLGPAQKDVLRCLVDNALVTALGALSDRAKEGNVQAIKLLIDYASQLKGDEDAVDFGDLTEMERKCLKEALIREIVSLRESSGGSGGMG
jgi:hypothetical protein